MRCLLPSVALPLLLALAVPVAAQSHAHRGMGAATAPAPAQRWKTDAALREGMGRIRAAVDGLGHYEHGHIGAEQALKLAASIEHDIGFIVSHCKLEPRADAALHPILGALMHGALALNANPADFATIQPMRDALQDYARTFDDPSVEASTR